MPRPRNKRPVSVAVYQSEYDGLWHSYLTIGRKANGDPLQAHRTGRSYDECADKIRELEDEIAAGKLIRVGRKPTVQQWFTTWLTDIAPHQPGGGSRRKSLAPRTLDDYWSRCHNWIFPHLGGLRLEELDTDHLDALYAAMYQAGKSSAHVLKVHAVIRRGLAVAMQRRKVSRNVASLIDNPGSPSARSKKALSLDQAHTALDIIDDRDDALRWKLGLALGPRQGEALGMRWSLTDLDEGTVDTSWQLQRRTWKHRCQPRCGRKRAAECPDRWLEVRKGEIHLTGGLVLCRRKGFTEDMVHLVALPPELIPDLRAHRKKQAAARLHAGELWEDYDLVFCQPTGRPIDPREDHAQWVGILRAAGFEDVGTHAMRHTAATLLLEMGVDVAVVAQMLGHADESTTRVYQQVKIGLQRRAAKRMGRSLFSRNTTDLATRRRKRGASGDSNAGS